MIKTYAIILASGSGSRFGSDLPKQFVKIGDKTILEYTLDTFEKSYSIDEIILVITPQYIKKAQEIVKQNNYNKISKIIGGGKSRKESSYLGINTIDDSEANVLIHDCARPFVSQETISKCVKSLSKYKAVTVGIPSTDTVIKVRNNIIEDIPNRSELVRVQTPQAFKLSLIIKAHKLAENDNTFTDDCGIIFKSKLAPIYVINGDTNNIKITYPEDIILANEIIKNQNL